MLNLLKSFKSGKGFVEITALDIKLLQLREKDETKRLVLSVNDYNN